jgi:hypothetical protein
MFFGLADVVEELTGPVLVAVAVVTLERDLIPIETDVGPGLIGVCVFVVSGTQGFDPALIIRLIVRPDNNLGDQALTQLSRILNADGLCSAKRVLQLLNVCVQLDAEDGAEGLGGKGGVIVIGHGFHSSKVAW